MPRSCRLFLALDLPPETRAQLAACAADLPGARWVAPEQLHLTLRFLGGVPETEIEGLRARLTRVQAPRFMLALAGVGVFPGLSPRHPPRVLWAGVAPADPVATLKRAIDAALGPDPECADRAFSPHVTLARFKAPPGSALPPYLQRHGQLASAAFPVDTFRLYESRTLSDGPRYAVLAEYPLAPL